tara:strand:- start:108481 stop:110841 length:2361 start_codon:yes stop_codon:yes gene_type:complete
LKEFGLVILYTLTVFLSACLLFSIQPMIAKSLLPIFGGGSSVWTTCMLFYQTLLLLGYLYAHILMTKFARRSQIIIHGSLLVLALVAGILIDTPEAPAQASTFPVPWLILQLMLISGLPFFAISSAGPLIQGWFSRTEHARAHDPYFLYAASNAGSLIGLLAYPLIFEPTMGLMAQRDFWLLGFGLFVVLAINAVLRTVKPKKLTPKEAKRLRKLEALVVSSEEPEVERLSWGRRMRWVYLAFIPSSMLLSVTTYITTDVVSLPLLWVLPLVVYLVTMILAFGSNTKRLVKDFTRPMVMLVISAMVLMMASEFSAGGSLYLVALIEFMLLFAIGMVCHGRLALDRPQAVHLTEFFLYMSVGGALGGIFNGIIGPLFFDTNLEYSITLVLAVSILPWSKDLVGMSVGKMRRIKITRRVGVPLFSILYVVFMGFFGRDLALWIDGVFSSGEVDTSPINMTLIAMTTSVPAFLVYLVWKDGLACALTLMLPMTAILLSEAGAQEVIHRARTFYGTHQVLAFHLMVMYEGEPMEVRLHRIQHGTTTHGLQMINEQLEGEPMGYYTREGPCGTIMKTVQELHPDGIRGAFLGLGAGGIAAFGREQDEMIFFEIDPEVDAIARNPEYFTYLSKSKADWSTRLGDGRKLLEDSAAADEEKFDIVLADAFSSDAIPVHLLTIEAINLYFERLHDDGMIVLHISNRFLDLMPLASELAHATTRIPPLVIDETVSMIPEEEREYHLASTWVVITRSIETGQRLIDNGMQVYEVSEEDQTKLWTDDFSNILSVIKFK